MGGVNLIGDGPMFQSLENEIKKLKLGDKMHLLGTKSQTEVPAYMQKADVFILPSIYDGWGAVVNEALQAGCYVICSDAAGASDLILPDERLGRVFNSGDECQLGGFMSWCPEHIREIRANRKFRLQWAQEHISGKAVARYLIDCLEKSLRVGSWSSHT